MTRHIQQTVDNGDCGVAVIAMATRKTYEEVMSKCPPDVKISGLWIPETLRILEKLEFDPWSSKYYTPLRVLSRYKFLKEDCIFGVYKPLGHFHYIFSDGEYLYDPLLPDRIALKEAQLGYWGEWVIYVELRR